MHLIACAAVTCIAGRLRLAFRAVWRAVETDMEVPIMPQPRLHHAQPRAIVTSLAAKCPLDGGVHKYAVDARILRCGRWSSEALPDGPSSPRPGPKIAELPAACRQVLNAP
jgi:hypothetical protein